MIELPPLPIAGTPRYAPERDFPPYRFIPGRHPHPTAHPDGHSRDREPDPSPAPDGSTWRTHGLYLHACDLYNHGYFWEAHEGWEELWHRTPAARHEKLVLQGLIQVAAAHLKERTGTPDGARRLARRATEKLRRHGARERTLGVDTAAFADAVEAWFEAGSAVWPTLALGP